MGTVATVGRRRRPRVARAVLTVLAVCVAGLSAPSLAERAAAAPVAVPDADYHALTPARLADTRPGQSTVDGQSAGTGQLAAYGELVVRVAGRGGVPTSGAVAVALNVTVTQPAAAGYVVVYPADGTRPNTSNLNMAAGQTVANSVVTTLSAAGEIRLYTSSATHLIVDVSGYFLEGGVAALPQPQRLADTRPGEKTDDGLFAGDGSIGAANPLALTVRGRFGVPLDATAVVLNVTVVGPSQPGFLVVYPNTSPQLPQSSNLNYEPGATVANQVITSIGDDDRVALYASATRVDVVVDVSAYFTGASSYHPLDPARYADSRPTGASVAARPGLTANFTSTAVGPVGTTQPNGTELDVLVSGRGNVPLVDVDAVVLNITVTDTTGPGFATVFPLGATQPNASILNYDVGETVPNLVVAKLGRDGGVSVVVSAPSANVIVDVVGYFPGPSTADVPGQYAFLANDLTGMPASFDLCRPIHYQINPDHAPAHWWVDDVVAAFAQVADATGLTFVRDPDTHDIAPRTADANGNPDPVLVAFGDETVYPTLAGDVIGYASPYETYYAGTVRWLPATLTSGWVMLDSGFAFTEGFGVGNTLGKLALHEIGHVMNLAHVDNTAQIMNPYLPTRAGGLGTGDRQGLALLYGRQTCGAVDTGAARAGTTGAADRTRPMLARVPIEVPTEDPDDVSG